MYITDQIRVHSLCSLSHWFRGLVNSSSLWVLALNSWLYCPNQTQMHADIFLDSWSICCPNQTRQNSQTEAPVSNDNCVIRSFLCHSRSADCPNPTRLYSWSSRLLFCPMWSAPEAAHCLLEWKTVSGVWSSWKKYVKLQYNKRDSITMRLLVHIFIRYSYSTFLSDISPMTISTSFVHFPSEIFCKHFPCVTAFQTPLTFWQLCASFNLCLPSIENDLFPDNFWKKNLLYTEKAFVYPCYSLHVQIINYNYLISQLFLPTAKPALWELFIINFLRGMP